MKRLGRFILWAVVFVVVLLAIDLSLIYLTPDVSFLSVPRRFYMDFRARLLDLVFPEQDPVAEKIITRKGTAPAHRDAPAGDGEPRYVYVDSAGELRFAVTLQEIPPSYRSEAKKLAR